MSSKRRIRARACQGKRAYQQQSEAAAIARRLAKETGAAYEAYGCRFADHWHVGRAKKVHHGRPRTSAREHTR